MGNKAPVATAKPPPVAATLLVPPPAQPTTACAPSCAAVGDAFSDRLAKLSPVPVGGTRSSSASGGTAAAGHRSLTYIRKWGTRGSTPDTAQLYEPWGLVWDPIRQHLVVADSGNHLVTSFRPSDPNHTPKLHPQSGVVNPSTAAWPQVWCFGTRCHAGKAEHNLNTPRGVCLEPWNDELIICDSANGRLVILDPTTGAFVRVLGKSAGLQVGNTCE
jgi:hypothetical protein